MEKLKKACSEVEETLQKALNNLREVRDYTIIPSETSSRIEEKASRLIELSIVCLFVCVCVCVCV